MSENLPIRPHIRHFSLLVVALCVLLPWVGRGQSYNMPRNTDTTISISFSSTSTVYHVYDDGGPSGNYSKLCNGTMTITSVDGRPFTIHGNYAISGGHCLTVYDGPSSSYPIVGFFTGDSSLSVFCHSGSVTLHFYSTSSNQNAGFSFEICYSEFYNVQARNTNSTYTTIGWNSPYSSSSQKKIRYYQVNDVTQSMTELTTYADSVNLNTLASGTKYAYRVRQGSFDSSTNDCRHPERYFRTPKIHDCPVCNHYRECLDYTSLTGAEQVSCYKGSTLFPDSALCVVDNGSANISSRHTVNTDSTVFSPNTGNGLRVIPTGDTASLRLGNWGGNHEGESVVYEIHVDTNDYDLMMLRYAVAMLLPTGVGNSIPRVSIRLLDENCHPIQPLCYSRDLMARKHYHKWGIDEEWNVTQSSNSNSCYWKDWQSMAINLSAYHGKVVYLQLTTSDGTSNGAAWAYFTLHCARKQVDHLESCGNSVENTFYAPEGFRYRWYNADSAAVTLSTTRSLHVTSSGLYHCQVLPSDCDDGSCGYVINALASVRYPLAAFDDTVVAGQCKFNVRFINRSTVVDGDTVPLWTNEDCESAYWDFGNGSTSTNYHAEATYYAPGTYEVMLISRIAGGGCTDTIRKQLVLQWEHASPYITGDTNICPGDEAELVVRNSLSQEWLFLYDGEEETHTDTLLSLDFDQTQLIRCTVSDSNGCNNTINCQLTVHPTFDLHDTLTRCQAQFPLDWRGHEYGYGSIGTSVYPYAGQSVWGCDSLHTLHLNVLPSYENSRTLRYCDYSTVFPYADSAYATLGEHTYVHHLPTGCDSIMHLTLSTVHAPVVHVADSVCLGFPYEGYDFSVSAAMNSAPGLHNYHHSNPVVFVAPVLADQVTCDSTTYLHLRVDVPTRDTVRMTLVQNQLPYTFNGVVFHGPVSDTAIVIRNVHGCDSTIVFSLQVNNNVLAYQQRTICADELPYQWDDELFNGPGMRPHTYTAHNGADSVVHRTLTVRNTYANHHYDTICSNQTASFNGHSYSLPGIYVDSLQSVHHCDSVELFHLTVHAVTSSSVYDTIVENQLAYSWNQYTFASDTQHCSLVISNRHLCDSVVDYSLYVYWNVYDTVDSTICQNLLPFSWNGETFLGAGTKTHTLRAHTGADSILTMRLHVNPNTDTSVTHSIVENELPYLFNGHTYTGEVTDDRVVVPNHYGCDSVIHFTLMVSMNQQHTVDSTVCASALPLQWNARLFAQAGVQRDTLTAVSGADSVVTMRLHVNPTYDLHFDTSICDNGVCLFADSVYTQAGTYTHHLLSSRGCDSVLTLTLSVRQVTHSTFAEEVVENALPHTFNGRTFASDTAHALVTITNTAGCDSIIDYTLTVWRNVRDTVHDTICDDALPFLWNSLTFVQAGAQDRLLHTSHGADSVVTHILTVHPTFHYVHPVTICSDTHYVFNGHVYASAGSYTDSLRSRHGCDSLETLHLSVIGVTASTVHDTVVENQLPWAFNGHTFASDTAGALVTITNVGGCDSTITYGLFVHRNVSASADSTICENLLPLQWNARRFTQAGTLMDTLTAHTGADSVLSMHLHVLNNTHGTLLDTCVENELPRLFHHYAFASDTSGAQLIIANADGCDSIVNYSLFVHHNIVTLEDSTVCASALPLQWNARLFTQAGTLSDTLQSVFLADSVVRMTLTVHDTFDHHFPETICDDASISFAGTTYTTSGDYRHLLSSVHGCDSAATLHLTVRAVTYAHDSADIVENDLPLAYNGRLFHDSVSHTPVVITNAVGCDSIIDFSIKVRWNVYDTARITICDDYLPYSWNDSVFLQAGSKTTVLPAASGADSILTMVLTVNPTRQVVYRDTICSNQSLLFNGHTLALQGSYVDTFATVHGCDSVETMLLTVWPTTSASVHDTIVENQLPWTFNAHTFASDTSDALVTIANTHGCDSTITYGLFVHRNVFNTVDSTLCENFLPLVWNGQTFSQAGTQQATLMAHTGADSVLTMHVHVDTNTHSTFFDTCIQNALPRLFNEVAFGSDTLGAVVTVPNDRGCDSVIYYNLYVHRNKTTHVDSVLCQNAAPLLWNGRTFNASGTDTAFLFAAHGEDSVVVMHVTVHPNTYAVLYDTIVQNQLPWPWHHRVFTAAGSLLDTLANAHGCDSLLTLMLHVWPNVEASADSAVCQNFFPFSWNGVVFDSAGTQQALLLTTHGADSLLTMNVTRLLNTFSTVRDTIVENQLPWTFNSLSFADSVSHSAVTIANVAGCDSIIDYSLHVHWNLRTYFDSTICHNFLPLLWDLDTLTGIDTTVHTLQCVNGADSVVTHRLWVNPTYRFVHYDTICNDTSYTFLDSVYTATGVYEHPFVSSLGCDSVEVLSLYVKEVTYAMVHDTIVENQLPWDYHGYVFADSMSHTQVRFPNVAGCDSIVDYSLFVHWNVHETLDSTVCENFLPLQWNHRVFDTAGTQLDTLRAHTGADSLLTMNLHVLLNSHTFFADTVIENDLPYAYLDSLFFNDQVLTPVVTPSANGCDSIVHFSLHVWHNIHVSVDTGSCEGSFPFFILQHQFDSAGVQTDSLFTIHGADSIVHIVVVEWPNYFTEAFDTICDYSGVMIQGLEYMGVRHFQTIHLCDSTEMFHLWANPVSRITFHDTVAESQLPVNIFGQLYDHPVDNQQFVLTNRWGCDSIVNFSL